MTPRKVIRKQKLQYTPLSKLRKEVKPLFDFIINNSDSEGHLYFTVKDICTLYADHNTCRDDHVKRNLKRLAEIGILEPSLKRLTTPFRNYYDIDISNKFEVYCAKLFPSGELLYIGSGKVGRHIHCNSGVSHSYLLNEVHFSKRESMYIEILKIFETKEEALAYEKYLIRETKPKFNVIHNK